MFITEREPDPQKTIDDFTGGTIVKPFDWRAYNHSQTREKIMFLQLLDDLCNVIDDDKYSFTGRKPSSLSHQIFCICLKVYLNTSSRRVISELELCKRKNLLNYVPHFNSIQNYFKNKTVKHTLNYLIGLSSLPLAQLETKFATDSSGFSEKKYMPRWSHVRQRFSQHQLYKKAHCIYGTYSNVVASCIVTKGTEADSPKFRQLLKNAADNFDVKEILADMAYSSRANLKYADQLGVTPYIPFKKNATGRSDGAIIWNKMYKYFKNNPKDFAKHYHLRSNAESGFFMIKQKFGDSIWSKDEKAQSAEILAKVLVHNICVLVQEIYLSNIEVDFLDCSKRYVAQPFD